MACGDNPETNITLSVSLLWIQTEDFPQEGDVVAPLASWQYQSSQATAQEQPCDGNHASQLGVLGQMAIALNVTADFGEDTYSLSSTELGILRFKHGPCRWEIGKADDLSAADVRKLVEIPGFCP
eukprot:2899389-Pleurochrysis_carterae.AAC.2